MQAALEVLDDGFGPYDKEGRLVLCNSAFKRMHPQMTDVLEPGLRYEDGLRIGLKRGIWAIGDQDPEEWVPKIITERTANPMYESYCG